MGSPMGLSWDIGMIFRTPGEIFVFVNENCTAKSSVWEHRFTCVAVVCMNKSQCSVSVDCRVSDCQLFACVMPVNAVAGDVTNHSGLRMCCI